MNRFRTVVITGAGTGIGRALAVGFASEDCIVIGLGLRPRCSKETKSLCKNGRYSYKIIDVLDNIAVSAIFAQITFEIGRSMCLSAMRRSILASISLIIHRMNGRARS